jgi:hypothetical protein
MILRIAFFAVLLSFSNVALAQDKPRAVFGEGLDSCGQWTQARQTPSAKAGFMAQWIAGFLSGRNLESPSADFLMGTDFDGLMGWIDNYCKTHPLDSITAAAFQLTDELRTRAGTRR